MRPMIDFFPETPAGFHLRVEETLASLEEREMKYVNKSKKLIVAVAAILLLALTAGAVAVVQGNALRTQMAESGGEEFAALVQDVHVMDGDGDFSFTIDEILWQGEKMYVSYTASVPDDGNVYLFSPCEVQLNGRAIEHNGLDAEFFTCAYALGGEYGSSVSQIMTLDVYAEQCESARFDCKCVFMEAQRPIEGLEEEAYFALFTQPDGHGNENQMMENADVLYYTSTIPEGDAVPVLYFHQYPEVRALIEADKDQKVTPEEIESTGIAKMAGSQEISISVHESEGEAPIYNDAAQRVYEMDGYSIELTELHISHFETRFKALIRKTDGTVSEWTPQEPYGQFYELCNADGGSFGTAAGWSIGGGEITLADGGEPVYCVDGFSEGIYPLEDLTEIYLAPNIFDENGVSVGRDMSRAICIQPIYNPNLPGSIPEPETDPAETDDLSS